MTCDKHKLTPAFGYSPCAGCEVERLNDKINKQKEIITKLEKESEDLKDQIRQYLGEIRKQIEVIKKEIRKQIEFS